MRILVMGTGAVGGYLGAILSRSGEDVVFVARGQNLDIIKTQGLRIESVAIGNFVMHPSPVEKLDGSWKADLVLFCVKGYQNEEAVETIRPAIAAETTILTLQNGIGSADQLAGAFGRKLILSGVIYIEVERKAPGVIAELRGECRIVFGEMDGMETERASSILTVLLKSGVKAELTSTVERELWNKLIFISALSGMTCVVRARFEEILDSPETLALTWSVMQETESVARAMGIDLDRHIVESTMSKFHHFKKELTSSMYADLEASKPLEISLLNGAVSKLGRRIGIPTPVNDFITACLTVADTRARTANRDV